MSFVIYNVKTFKRAFGYRAVSYETASAAKSVRTRGKLDPQEWAIDTYDNWVKNDPMVVTYSIHDVKKQHPVMIRASDKGTCVDVGTETYWSM